jgi:hypothetical protein
MILLKTRFSYISAGALVFGGITFTLADEPCASRVVNRACAEKWVMKIEEGTYPVGVLKVFRAGAARSGKPLATLQKPGQAFTLDRMEAVDIVIVPNRLGIALTLGFLREGAQAGPCFQVNIHQVGGDGGDRPMFGVYMDSEAVTFNPQGYQGAGERCAPFIEVG